MERDAYNLKAKDCVYSDTYGPLPTNTFKKKEFIGDNIYTEPEQKSSPEKNIICNLDNSLIDCSGNPRMSLPLSDYYRLRNL